MSAAPSNATFISYRRDPGWTYATMLFQQLTASGVDAFYDVESIRAGHFDTTILTQIAARPYFLLVLTPGTLDRCNEPSDWLRREIDQAVATQRVIVPVHTPNFDFHDLERFLPNGLGARFEDGRGKRCRRSRSSSSCTCSSRSSCGRSRSKLSPRRPRTARSSISWSQQPGQHPP
jgi:hypothetical protein